MKIPPLKRFVELDEKNTRNYWLDNWKLVLLSISAIERNDSQVCVCVLWWKRIPYSIENNCTKNKKINSMQKNRISSAVERFQQKASNNKHGHNDDDDDEIAFIIVQEHVHKYDGVSLLNFGSVVAVKSYLRKSVSALWPMWEQAQAASTVMVYVRWEGSRRCWFSVWH